MKFQVVIILGSFFQREILLIAQPRHSIPFPIGKNHCSRADEPVEDEEHPSATLIEVVIGLMDYFETLGRTLKPKNHNMQNKRIPAGSSIKAVEHFAAVSCRSSSSSFEAGLKIIFVTRAGTVRRRGHALCVSQQRIAPTEQRKILRLTAHFFNTDFLPPPMMQGPGSVLIG